MAATDLTAGEVMDKAASLMNDTAKTVYTYAAQMPYLNMALDELMEHLELHNIPITSKTSASITVNIGTTQINPESGFEPPNLPPTYPSDLVSIEQIWERLAGSTDPFVPLVQREFLPHYVDDILVDSLIYWAWQDQRIKFIGATTNREVKLDYVAKVKTNQVVSSGDQIGIINARTFLYYRTAAICSQFIGENPTRAGELNQFAQMAVDRMTGIEIKSKQSVQTRRRPFRASYKQKGF
jgi:hypothetical protein